MITASSKSGAPRQLPPAGTHVARCYQLIDLGTHEKTWPGKPPRPSHEIRVSWELPLETAVFQEDKGAQPFSVHKTYTLSLSEKANLRHDLENWRGKPFDEAELQAFDVAKLLGKACMVTVTHVTKGDNTYANVTAVSGIPKGLSVPPAVNPAVEYSLEAHNDKVFAALPDFLKDIITTSREWKVAQSSDDPPDSIPMDDPDGDDPNIPFNREAHDPR